MPLIENCAGFGGKALLLAAAVALPASALTFSTPAGAHGLFWEMHSAIYAIAHQLSGVALFALASKLGLDVAELRNALEAGTYAPKVDADFFSGIRSGVNGTPCFFVNGERHDGAYDAATLATAIEATATAVPSNVVRIAVE